MTDDRIRHERRQLEALRETVARLVVVVALAPVAVALFAPMVDWEQDGRTSDDDEHLSLFDLIAGFEDFDARYGGALAETHPIAIGVGLPLMKWAAVLLLLSLLGAAAAALGAWRIDDRGPRVAVRLAAGAVMLSGLALWLAVLMLPETRDSFSTNPAWGLWLPLMAGAWLLAGHRDLLDIVADPPLRREDWHRNTPS